MYKRQYSVNLQYKNFDLGIDFQVVYGNEIFNTSFLSAYAQYNYHTKRLGRWNGEGTSNWEPILDSSRATQMMNSSYFIEDGSYLRLKNIQLVTVSATGSSRRSVSKRCACS